MYQLIALTTLLGVFAFGQWVAEKSKAVLSTALVMSIVLLLAFWLGLPKNIFDLAAVNDIGMILINFLIVILGTTMDLKELARQWKTVIISFIAVVFAVGAIIFIGSLIIDKNMAIAGSPIFAGGNVAALMMKEALEQSGNIETFQFVVLVLVTQSFMGIPLASYLLRKEAKIFLKNPANIEKYYTIKLDNEDTIKKKKPLTLPKSMNLPSILFTKIGIIGILSQYLASLTNGTIHTFVVALILGVIFTELGFLEPDSLNKTGAETFIVFATTIIIFTGLIDITPAQLLSLLFPLLVCLLTGTIGVIIAGFITSKLLKVSINLAIAQGISCTFGFPTTLFIPKEVSNAISSNEKEKVALENYLLPKMLISGFVTVTISSVLLASVVVKMYF